MDILYSKACLMKIIKEKQIAGMRKYVATNDQEKICNTANMITKHIFLFDKPWDMERCVIPYTVDPMDFYAQRNDDEEWCFMLNRMAYLDDLMMAGVCTNQKKYFSVGKELILLWIKTHATLAPDCTTRTLDMGIRIFNIVECLPYLLYANQLDAQELQSILLSIQDQICFMKEHYLPKYITSNWGSIQMCAIVSVLPILDQDYAHNNDFLWAKEELCKQMHVQVYEDGMLWEQSTMYHIEVLHSLMYALFYQRMFPYAMDSIVAQAAHKLGLALLYQLTPTHCIEAFGDSDRIMASDVFHRFSVLFDEPIAKYVGEAHFDYEALYHFGCLMYAKYEAMPRHVPASCYYDGVDSGMYCIRSSWATTASFTMFTNGSLGSGHGHSDNLHISIYYKGEPFLIDTGRYTYREDHPLRVYLKRMIAHNCVCMDDHEYSMPYDSWTYQDFGVPLKNYSYHHDHIHYIEGGMIGHHPLQIWMRKVVIIDPGIWMIVDEVKADGKHQASQYFHVDPSKQVVKKDTGYELIGEASLQMTTNLRGDTAMKKCSLRYNEVCDHVVIKLVDSFEDEGVMITCLHAVDIQVEKAHVLQNMEVESDASLVSAYTFHISTIEQYTIGVFHKEVYKGKKIFSCQGIPLHTKVFVLHTIHDTTTLWRLRS